jgi:hypothetical protein
MLQPDDANLQGRSKMEVADERKRPLWERILELLEEDLAECRDRKYVVEVRGESGPDHKDIGELSPEELKSLDSAVREWVADRLLDRYLAEQGRVDLLEKKRSYTKRIRDLTPADLPAVIAAELFRTEELRREREREDLVRGVHEDLDRLDVAEFVEIGVAAGREG